MTNQSNLQACQEISSSPFGTLPDGSEVRAYTLTNKNGMKVKVLDYGAVITECWVPDSSGQLTNVVLGFDNLAQYLGKHPRFGSTIGRYVNRISKAQFELDGVKYQLAANNGSNCIHGGINGFDKHMWKFVHSSADNHAQSITLNYHSADMEEGFPGNLDLTLVIALTDQNALRLTYKASADKATPVNLTNHSYFNLNGAGKGNILQHLAKFYSESITPLNSDSVPTGEIASVVNTPYDFTNDTAIGANIGKLDGGFDINYVVGRHSLIQPKGAEPAPSRLVAHVRSEQSGIKLDTYSDQPGFQFFTANGLDGSIKGLGGSYEKHAGFCIETQHFADSVHHENFPNTILRPGEEFNSTTIYAF
jgi:aldose 1-epimerase